MVCRATLHGCLHELTLPPSHASLTGGSAACGGCARTAWRESSGCLGKLTKVGQCTKPTWASCVWWLGMHGVVCEQRTAGSMFCRTTANPSLKMASCCSVGLWLTLGRVSAATERTRVAERTSVARARCRPAQPTPASPRLTPYVIQDKLLDQFGRCTLRTVAVHA